MLVMILFQPRLTSEGWMNVGISVDPAVEFGVGLHLVVTYDGLFVKVVLHGNEEETEHDEEGAGLVVELEQRAVHLDSLVQEPLDELPEERQPVPNAKGSHEDFLN